MRLAEQSRSSLHRTNGARKLHHQSGGLVARIRQPISSTSSAPWTARVVVPVRSEAQAPAALPRLERPSPSQILQEIVDPVAADMDTMNQNLRSIVGDRHPMLMAAADQIFGAGGKKLRPMIVLLMARATAEMAGLRCAAAPCLHLFPGDVTHAWHCLHATCACTCVHKLEL